MSATNEMRMAGDAVHLEFLLVARRAGGDVLQMIEVYLEIAPLVWRTIERAAWSADAQA